MSHTSDSAKPSRDDMAVDLTLNSQSGAGMHWSTELSTAKRRALYAEDRCRELEEKLAHIRETSYPTRMPEPTIPTDADMVKMAIDLFGNDAEPLTENQYLSIKCVLDERTDAENRCRVLEKRLAEIKSGTDPLYHHASPMGTIQKIHRLATLPAALGEEQEPKGSGA